jgi:hypothetical protein
MDKKRLQIAMNNILNARTMIEEIRDSEQEGFDTKSDTWKESDAGQASEEKLNELSETLNSLEDAETHLQEVIGD